MLNAGLEKHSLSLFLPEDHISSSTSDLKQDVIKCSQIIHLSFSGWPASYCDLQKKMRTCICTGAKVICMLNKMQCFERITSEELDPLCLISKIRGAWDLSAWWVLLCPWDTDAQQDKTFCNTKHSALQKTLQGQFEQGRTMIYSKEGMKQPNEAKYYRTAPLSPSKQCTEWGSSLWDKWSVAVTFKSREQYTEIKALELLSPHAWYFTTVFSLLSQVWESPSFLAKPKDPVKLMSRFAEDFVWFFLPCWVTLQGISNWMLPKSKAFPETVTHLPGFLFFLSCSNWLCSAPVSKGRILLTPLNKTPCWAWLSGSLSRTCFSSGPFHSWHPF